MRNKETKISQLKNLGKQSEQWLNEFDIYTLNDLQKYDPVVLYKIMKTNGYPVSVLFIYAIQGALMDIHWNDLPKEMKAKLKSEALED